MKDPIPERILNYLREVEEATPTQIHKGCKIHYYLLSMYLNRLKEEGKIISRTNSTGKYTYYRLSTKGEIESE